MQRALPIPMSTFSTTSRRFRPPEGTCPSCLVKGRRTNTEVFQKSKQRTCPDWTSFDPFSRKSKLSRRLQLYQDLKFQFWGRYSENWWIGVWVPGGRTWFRKHHKSTMQQRGKKSSEFQRILHIEHTPIDTTTYCWQHLLFISLCVEWKVLLGTCS